MANTNVLVDIFNTLNRLESRLEGQDFRLDTIEHSIRSGSISPSDDVVDFPVSPDSPGRKYSRSWKEKPLPAEPTPPAVEVSSGDLYAASIMEMRRKFEFVDDSRSVIHEAFRGNQSEAGPSMQRHQLHPHVPALDNEDAYTHSVYSMDVLSASRILLPNLASQLRPTEIEVNSHPSGLAKRKDTFVTVLDGPSQPEPVSPQASTRSISFTMRSWRSRSSRKSIDSQRSMSSQESHETAAMTFYACNNFVESLQISRSPRSPEKQIQAEERMRLKALAMSADLLRSSSVVNLSGRVTWMSTLRKVLGGLFSGAVRGRAQNVYVVA